MNTMFALERTGYTNFLLAHPAGTALHAEEGRELHYNCRISDVDFEIDSGGKERWIERIHLETESGEHKPSIQVRDTDLVFLTIGSEDQQLTGAHDRLVDKPAVGSQNPYGAWTLWKKIAASSPTSAAPTSSCVTSQSKMMTLSPSARLFSASSSG